MKKFFEKPNIFYLDVFVLFCLLVILPACISTPKSNSVVWKSVDFYNGSGKQISVTSLQGIQAYGQNRGPQDLRCGNLASGVCKSIETMRNLNITYPVMIKWIDGLVTGYDAEFPTTGPNVYQQTISKFRGLPSGVAVIKEEASLLLVFAGSEWEAYYVSGNSGLGEDEILTVIESAKRDH